MKSYKDTVINHAEPNIPYEKKNSGIFGSVRTGESCALKFLMMTHNNEKYLLYSCRAVTPHGPIIYQLNHL